jgi:hypothetical protein
MPNLPHFCVECGTSGRMEAFSMSSISSSPLRAGETINGVVVVFRET